MRSDQGLNAVVRPYSRQGYEVPVANAGVLRDIDTPEEFENLLQKRH